MNMMIKACEAECKDGMATAEKAIIAHAAQQANSLTQSAQPASQSVTMRCAEFTASANHALATSNRYDVAKTALAR